MHKIDFDIIHSFHRANREAKITDNKSANFKISDLSFVVLWVFKEKLIFSSHGIARSFLNFENFCLLLDHPSKTDLNRT